MGSYHSDADFGQLGVRRLAELLRRDSRTNNVHDVQSQALDHDLVWELNSGEVVTIEVKYERIYTGNLFLETISNTTTGSPGWLWTSKAKLLAYGFHSNESWYQARLPDLQRHIRRWRSYWPTATASTYGQYSYETKGILFSIVGGLDLRKLFHCPHRTFMTDM